MTGGKTKRINNKILPPMGLVFAEDANDANSLIELTKDLWADSPPIHHARQPLILVKDRQDAEARKNATKVAGAAMAFGVRKQSRVQFVIAHQDCDAVEPANEALAEKIRSYLESGGIKNVVPVAPAWEIEAWWFLWPDAVAAVNSKWKKLKASNANHGMVLNAKEALRKALREKGANDYEESDAPKIAAKVRELKLIKNRAGTAASFTAFELAIEDLLPKKSRNSRVVAAKVAKRR